MRVILDECVPRKLGPLLASHAVTTVPREGWAGKKNGELLRLISGRFDILVTTDTKLPSQQDLSKFAVRVIALQASGNSLEDIRPLVPRLLHVIAHPATGRVVILRRARAPQD